MRPLLLALYPPTLLPIRQTFESKSNRPDGDAEAVEPVEFGLARGEDRVDGEDGEGDERDPGSLREEGNGEARGGFADFFEAGVTPGGEDAGEEVGAHCRLSANTQFLFVMEYIHREAQMAVNALRIICRGTNPPFPNVGHAGNGNPLPLAKLLALSAG